MAEAERLWPTDQYAAAVKAYQVQLGMPKHKRLLKFLQEQGAKKLVLKVELDYLADRKLPARQQRLHDLEEELYFVLDEKRPLGPPHRPGRRDPLAEGPDAVHRPRPLGGGPPDREGRNAHAAREAGAARAARGGLRRQEREAAHHPPAAPGLRALREGRRVRGAGRPDLHRGRVHRPHPAGAPLVGRPAPGRRGQGGRAGQGRDPDARHDHDPELLPDVRQAGRDDRHRRDRGGGVLQDLQAGGDGHPDQPSGPPHRRARPHLQDPPREVQRHRGRGRAAAWPRPAGAGRHRERRGVGDALADAQAAGRSSTRC